MSNQSVEQCEALRAACHSEWRVAKRWGIGLAVVIVLALVGWSRAVDSGISSNQKDITENRVQLQQRKEDQIKIEAKLDRIDRKLDAVLAHTLTP